MRQGGENGVVTPEAVRLDFEEATVGSRGVAIAIDWAVQFATLLVGSFAVALLSGFTGPAMPAWVGFTLLTVATFLVLFGYPIAMETLNRGRSLGKAALGLRVVTVEGGPVGFRHAATRAALGLVDFAVTSGFVAVITALVSSRSQRLGDHLAGTVVVRERTGAGKATAAAFEVPRGYDSYAATIDPAGLRPEDYQAIRTFLLRAQDLPPERRAALGQRLAAGIARRVAHRIPGQLHPETFLLCAAARYQARHTAGSPDAAISSTGSSAWSAPGTRHEPAATPNLLPRGSSQGGPSEAGEAQHEQGPVPQHVQGPASREGFTAPG